MRGLSWPTASLTGRSVAALEADQYAGYLVVETHVKKRPPGLQMRDGLDGWESNGLDNLDCLRTRLQRLAD